MSEPRYFVDHETIHDRVTGKHVELHEAADLLSAEPADVQRIAWGVVVKLGAMLKNMEAERDSALAELEQVKRERDEARIKFEAVDQEMVDICRQRLEWMKERDTAITRAEVAERPRRAGDLTAEEREAIRELISYTSADLPASARIAYQVLAKLLAAKVERT